MKCRGLHFRDEDAAHDYFLQLDLDDAREEAEARGRKAWIMALQEDWDDLLDPMAGLSLLEIT